MQDYAELIDQVLDFFQAILLSFLIKLGPFFVALMPALFTGYAIFHTFETEAGFAMALLFAGTVGLAMETVGIVSTHTAIDLYNGWSEGRIQAFKAWLMALLVPVYVLGVAGAVWYSENAFTPLVKALGVISPFLTCIVYIAVALARDLSKIEQKKRAEQGAELKLKQEERSFERDLRRQRLGQEHELRLKQLELTAQVQIEQNRAPAVPAPSQPELAVSQHFKCPDCKRDDFKTIQALNAHKGHCKGLAVTVNGRSY